MRIGLILATSTLALSLTTGANAQKIDWNIFAEPFISPAHAQDMDWQKVDETLGRKPAVSGDVHRYGFPRSDLSVTLDGVTIKPALALGGWVAFKPAHGGVMVMGDLVLLESEINPVMAKMIANGLEMTAVHNHLLRRTPRPSTCTSPVTAIPSSSRPQSTTRWPKEDAADGRSPASPPPAIDLDTAQLDQIIGVKGQANGGVYQFTVPRRDPITEKACSCAGRADGRRHRHQLPADRRRQGRHHRRLRSDGRGSQSGDHGASEHGIEVTALHSHMLDEEPRLFFMHFWANDDAIKLAKGLRAALDKTASTKS